MTTRATASELPPYQHMVPDGVDDELRLMHLIDGELCIDYADGEVKVQGCREGGFGGGNVLLGSRAVYVWLDEGRRMDTSGHDDASHDDVVGGMRIMHRDMVDVQARRLGQGRVSLFLHAKGYTVVDPEGRRSDQVKGEKEVKLWVRMANVQKRYLGDSGPKAANSVDHQQSSKMPLCDCVFEIHELYRKSRDMALDVDEDGLDLVIEKFKGKEKARLMSMLGAGDVAIDAVRVFPLCELPGMIQMSDTRLMFHSFCSSSSKGGYCVEIGNIYCIRRRRSKLVHRALELFFTSGETHSSLLFAVDDEYTDTLDGIISKLMRLTRLDDSLLLDDVTEDWRHGGISNFEYLMALNDAAGRSFNDISQYPVFPWVIADYMSDELDLSDPLSFRDISKPIAAVNEHRLSNALEMFNALNSARTNSPAWMYGSHYSNPGIVVYFKVRQCPELMLKLQGRKFDSPNRMFHSISSTWNSASSQWPNDVKELIPELYHPSGVSLLVNSKGLAMGKRSDGAQIDSVILPPWANGSASEFIKKMGQALESDYVSSGLHRWIDLVFGIHSRGRKAEKYNNVFYYMTYDDIAIEQIEAAQGDQEKKDARTLEAQEYGRTPMQLFIRHHPKKKTAKSNGSFFLFRNMLKLTCACASPVLEDQAASNVDTRQQKTRRRPPTYKID
eukprot:jgi/Picsp_1/4122/NSC_01632-R1_beach domain-containing protein